MFARGAKRTFLAAALLLAVASTALNAEEAAKTPDPATQTDVRDVWHHFRHTDTFSAQPAAAPMKRFFVFAPTISSKPSTGLVFGVGTTLAFVAGDAATTHLSSASANARVSMKAQTLTSFRYGMFTDGDRWFVQGDNRFQWTSLDTYAVGGDSLSSSGTNLEYDWYRVYDTAYRRVAPRLFVGGGLNVSDHANVHDDNGSVDRAAYAQYSVEHGFTVGRQVSSGTNMGVVVDTRDNSINASQGWLASGVYRTFFNRFLGGEATFQELNVDVRTYRTLTRSGRQKIAVWFLGDLVTGGTAPYFELPYTGGDLNGRSSRGYAEGRYRGPHLLYSEIEYRASVVPSGLVGVVAFVNTATIDGGAPDRRLFQSFEPAAGGGARILLDKHSRTNLCVDYGWGRQGSRGLYLGMQEAF